MAMTVNPLSSAVAGAYSAKSSAAEQISSGQRINSAADDAAGLSISSRMDAELAGKRMALRNAADGISYAQTASGALESLSSNVSRIRELAVQAGNGILSDSDRQAIQSEINALNDENRSVLENTTFNGKAIFSADEPRVFQVGESAGDTITIDPMQVLELGSFNGNVASSADVETLINSTDDDLQRLSSAMADTSAVANRFESTMERLSGNIGDNAVALSRLRDTDMAQAAARQSNEDIRNQIQIAVQAQANARAPDVLRLLS